MNPAEARRFLGVDQYVTLEELKKVYRAFAMKHHPDRNGDPNVFMRYTAAYDVLKVLPEKKRPDPSHNSRSPRYEVYIGADPTWTAIVQETNPTNREVRLDCHFLNNTPTRLEDADILGGKTMEAIILELPVGTELPYETTVKNHRRTVFLKIVQSPS